MHIFREDFMKTKLLKLLVVMTISITALFALGITASAATAGDFTITLTEGGGDPVVDTDYTYVEYPYAPGVLTIKSSAAMTISGLKTPLARLHEQAQSPLLLIAFV